MHTVILVNPVDHYLSMAMTARYEKCSLAECHADNSPNIPHEKFLPFSWLVLFLVQKSSLGIPTFLKII
jgi:hypothetical protein